MKKDHVKPVKEATILLTAEEKNLIVHLLNEQMFRIRDLVLAHNLIEKIDDAFPIMEE